MSREAAEHDFDPAYIAGLLDATGRVRFDISDSEDGTYTVRPMLRIRPKGTQMREAVIGEFLEARDYRYEYIERDYGEQFFQLQLRPDLADLEKYLAGQSAHLQRELAFANGVFAEEFDFDILEPVDVYRFLLARDELRYGWRPRGRYHVPPSEIVESHDIDQQNITPPRLPIGDLRTDYSIEWVAGVFDGLCRYRPGIAQSEEHFIGYAMYPTARLQRAGVHSKFVNHIERFCIDYDLKFGNSNEPNTLNIVFTGPTNIRRILDVLFPRLLVLAEHSMAMLEEILPRFDQEAHHGKQGFYELLRDFYPIAKASGGPFNPRYNPDYFADLWRDELDLRDVDKGSRDHASEPTLTRSEELKQIESLSISAEEYRDRVGRYHSLVDCTNSDPEHIEEMKRWYNDRCQICGERRAAGDGTGYAEVHYLKPLGEPHEGPASSENILVVCPNHHADLDNGVIRIQPDSLTIEHPYDTDVDGEQLIMAEDHTLEQDFVEYHNRTISRLRSVGIVD